MRHCLTFRLHCGAWVVDCISRQAYKVSVIMAPCKRWSWAWGKCINGEVRRLFVRGKKRTLAAFSVSRCLAFVTGNDLLAASSELPNLRMSPHEQGISSDMNAHSQTTNRLSG